MLIKRRPLIFGAAALAQMERARAQPFGAFTQGSNAYKGPGDIASGAAFYIGLRAYSSAQTGGTTKAFNLRRGSGGQQDFNILSTGLFDVAGAVAYAGTDATGTGAIVGTTMTFTNGHIGDTVTGTGVSPGTFIVSGSSPTWTVYPSQTVASTTLTLTWGLYVTEGYDQTGNGANLTQATTTAQMLFLPTGGPAASLPTLWCDPFGASTFLSKASAITPMGVPYTLSVIAKTTSTIQQWSLDLYDGGADGGILTFNRGAANDVDIFDGATTTSVAATVGAWHAVQAVAGGSTTTISADGTPASQSSAASVTSATVSFGGSSDGSSPHIGPMFEGIGWRSAITASAVNTNQHAIGGGW